MATTLLAKIKLLADDTQFSNRISLLKLKVHIRNFISELNGGCDDAGKVYGFKMLNNNLLKNKNSKV